MPVPRIITRRIAEHADSHTIERFLATGGYDGLRKALSMTPEQVQKEVLASNLLGRGGAGFEAGKKWSMMRKAPTRYLVVNGDESEPATFKDHMLVEGDPNQLVEGTIICAYAVQANQAFIYLRGEFALGLERVQQAVNDAYRNKALGNDIFGSGFSLDIVVQPGAGAYICGEETALIESLEGRRGMPRIKPPYFPAAMGLYGEPTIVNNVETLSNMPWIISNGGAAFAALGAGRSTGTRIFALSGHVKNPANYEVEMVKTTFRNLIYDEHLGGGIRGDKELKCLVPGGASAPWFGPQHLDLPLGQDEVGRSNGVLPGGGGSMLGSGSIVVMDEDTDVVRAAWRLARFFARESCGKCTPCREGTSWLDKVMKRIVDGHGRPEDLDLLRDVCDNIAPGLAFPYAMTTICFLGPSAAMPIMSALTMFPEEFERRVGARAARQSGEMAAPSTISVGH
jgi:NADH-quinone oxidoreductase subunit F